MRYFPLFLDIAGKPVLLVGGGAIAARKFFLLTEARARVTVVAPELGDEMRAALERGAFTYLARPFAASDLENKWLAIAATNDAAVNARVAAVAAGARIPCNVVDDRELSSFIMPAIIDRSPVQIAVSTGGTSPVLARLIRERLETLLDGSLGTLAAFADKWRGAIKQKFADIGARRRFLSWMLTGPVAGALRADRTARAEELTRQALESADGLPDGHVVLVGAGPGNAGLMTLQGLRALQEADVIVHDRLVSAEVLDLARRDAARFDVGKFVGGGGATQEEINKLLVEHARRGEYVVRLKGGDPFVFGRGGEEIDYLRQNGVSFEVIPGITAALAAGAYSGIPLTDRRHAQAVRLLTGNSDEQLAQFSYSDLAAGRETLAFYMSVGRLVGLRARLLEAGVAGDMPVAFIENASRAEQRVILTTVDGMQRDAGAHQVKAPTLMIIGNVAGTAAELQWFGRAAVVGGAVIAMAVIVVGCAREQAPEAPAVTDQWLGQWNGPEGTFLKLEGGKGAYTVTIQDLDGAKTFAGVAAGNSIRFERNGVSENIRATDGVGTGMKWLSEKKDCLTIKSGEGFCRD